MDVVKERVVEHLKLAQIIAAKYFNIPGASREEVLSEARMALVKASMAYQEDKGPFIPFAGTVIRNALNSLFKKQLRQVQMIGKSLDETIHGATQFGTHIGNLGQNLKDTRKNVFQEVLANENKKNLHKVIECLTEKEIYILSRIKNKVSLKEIGDELGISKQGVYKKWLILIKKLQKQKILFQ